MTSIRSLNAYLLRFQKSSEEFHQEPHQMRFHLHATPEGLDAFSLAVLHDAKAIGVRVDIVTTCYVRREVLRATLEAVSAQVAPLFPAACVCKERDFDVDNNDFLKSCPKSWGRPPPGVVGYRPPGAVSLGAKKLLP